MIWTKLLVNMEKLRQKNKNQKENNRMAIMMKAEERRRQMEEDIRNLREQKKNNEELRKYIEVEELSFLTNLFVKNPEIRLPIDIKSIKELDIRHPLNCDRL